MRLNFSNASEDDLREGIRRIGKVIAEQVDAVRHARPARRACASPVRRERPASPAADDQGARIVPLPRRAHGRSMSRVAVLKGGASLERQVSLRSGARVEDALARLGHEVGARSTSATT